MTTNGSNPSGRLEPASLDIGNEGRAYSPKLPWKWFVGVGGLAVFFCAYWFNQQRQTEALRSVLMRSYEVQVRPQAEKVRKFKGRLEKWAMDSARQKEPVQNVDERLNIAGLHDAQGLYLRVTPEDAGSSKDISRAATAMGPDAITKCLGITPISLGGLYEKTALFDAAWLDKVKRADSVMRLRVLEDELRRRLDRDLPLLLTMMQSQYFLLVVQRGDNRREHPVDVFLWELKHGKNLLSMRTQAQGKLIPARIALNHAPTFAKERPSTDTGGANDCSIAAQVKSAQ